MLSTFAPRPAVTSAAATTAPAVPASFDAPDSDLDHDELRLPAAWSPPARPPLPVVASFVPVIGAVALWFVTGSILALLLAGLGPLIAVASILDARRVARRDRRRTLAEAAVAHARVAAAVTARHDDERRRRWARHPDVAAFIVRDGDVWRSAAGRGELIVVGAGDMPSGVRVTGGDGDPDAAALRARAARVSHAPVVLPAAAGIAVVGTDIVAASVVRALTLQLCLALAPGELRLIGDGEDWLERLPHRAATSGLQHGAATSGLQHGAATSGLALAVVAEGAFVPDGADAVIAHVAPGGLVPPACRAVLTVAGPHRATLEYDGDTIELSVEAIGRDQAVVIADALAERAARTVGVSPAGDEPVRFDALPHSALPARRGALAAAVGRSRGDTTVVDLVADGPHAVVAGVTGSGKSELLITWILALAATHSTREVNFLLADFKGGTAFDSLADLPHVTGVITDLDGAGARRAIESLRAEVRWREGELARCGARDILDPRIDLPRLVVVVDEFAALLGDHPELHAVFGDVAARGRALGLHLVLGTQRVAGVVRDSLLANCPLRISLRVTDGADSRAVIGTDEAALLPGGAEGRGVALVRRACDSTPRTSRIALSTPADIAAIAHATDGPLPRRPWLPGLPARVPLGDLGVPRSDGVFVLGLADEPDQQRQEPATVHVGDRGVLVVGGPGSGKSTALTTLAAQAPGAVVRIPATGEGAWDAVAGLVEAPPARGTVVVVDDLDAVATRLPPDHAHELMSRLERIFRGAGDAGIFVAASTQRLTGPAARLGDLLPRRIVLAMATRADHIAAGGDPAHYAPDAPPGRGRLGGVAVQVAVAAASSFADVGAGKSDTAAWRPSAAITALVTRRAAAVRPAIEAWTASGIRAIAVDDYATDPSIAAEGAVVIVGDPDDWQRHWRLLAAARGDHDLIVDTSCAAEFRTLTGTRELPPYAEQGAGRAWLMSAGSDPVRIVLPRADPTSALDRPILRP